MRLRRAGSGLMVENGSAANAPSLCVWGAGSDVTEKPAADMVAVDVVCESRTIVGAVPGSG